MTQKILNNTLCGLLAYFVLGLFLLGKGSFASAATPLAWQFRIFAMAGFLVVALGLFLLCRLGKREADRSLRRLMSNTWAWGVFGLLTVLGYGAMTITSLIVGGAPYEPGDISGVIGTWPFWVNATGAVLFGGNLSVLSAFVIVGQQKSTYSDVLLAVTLYVLALCVATFLLANLPSDVVLWINFVAVILFWVAGIAVSRRADWNLDEGSRTGEEVLSDIDLTALTVDSESEDTTTIEALASTKTPNEVEVSNMPHNPAVSEPSLSTPLTNNPISEDAFDIRNSGHELPAMLISSLLGVFLFGLTSNSDGNPGLFDLGHNALFGMLIMAVILLPVVYALRKRNLVPIFYWLVFPLIASVLIVLDTFPENNPLAFAGSAGVYFFCTVVFLFSLALLVMLVQNSEGSPYLPIILAEITLAVACLCGVAVANIFPDQDVRGPIVLITATVYFIYVLLTPILLFWQSRKSVQAAIVETSATELNPQQPETSELPYEDRINAIAATFALSKREHEILELVGKGYNSPYIAAALVISENTTRTHLKNIYRKLGVGSRMEVVDLVNSWDQHNQNEQLSQMTVK